MELKLFPCHTRKKKVFLIDTGNFDGSAGGVDMLSVPPVESRLTMTALP